MLRKIAVLGLAAAVSCVCVRGQSNEVSLQQVATVQPSSAASSEQAPDVVPIVRYGFDVRFRPEDLNNYSDFDDKQFDVQHRWRVRTRAWGQLAITDSVDVYLRVANEWRKVTDPDTSLKASFPDETVVDNLYLDFKRLPLKGLSLRAGRQDIRKGEGFIFGDGTALDGSRTGYLNAFDLAYKAGKTTVELIGAVQPQMDHYLPRANNRDKRNVEYNEGVIGVYATTSRVRGVDVDVYYLLKRETDDYRSTTSYAFTPDRHFTTAGGRVNRSSGDAWTATAEFAYQFGAQHSNPVTQAPPANIAGWGGYGTVTRAFVSNLAKPYVSAGYFALSGDDYSSSTKVEGWDPVFSRFAIRSDLLFNGFKSERGTGYWTNVRMPQVTFGVKPSKRLNAYASWMYVDAFHPFTVGPSKIFGSGTHRGTLVFSRAEMQLNPALSAQVQYESMWQGNYYSGRDRAYYFRAQLTYTLSGQIGSRAPKK